MTKEIKITITDGETQFYLTGLSPVEAIGYLRVYEKRLSLEILRNMDSEPETKEEVK